MCIIFESEYISLIDTFFSLYVVSLAIRLQVSSVLNLFPSIHRCSTLIIGFLYHPIGLTGSVVLRSGRLSDLISQLQELLKGVTEAELSPSPHKYDTAILAAQVRSFVSLNSTVHVILSQKKMSEILLLFGNWVNGKVMAKYLLTTDVPQIW